MAIFNLDYIRESHDKSILSKDFKSKEIIKLSDLTMKSRQRNDEGKSLVLSWYKDGDFVATVLVDTIPASDGYKWFGSLRVSKKYRGHSLGNQIIKLLISNKYNAGALSVHKDNEIAIKLYKNFGFEISKTRTDDEYYFMYLKKNKIKILKESKNENTIDTIVFDFGGVLIGTDKNAEKIAWDWADKNNISKDEMVNGLIMKYYEAIQYNELYTRNQCKSLFKKIVKPEYIKYTDEIFDLMESSKVLCDHTIKLLDKLKTKGYKLYYLSNVSKYNTANRKSSGLLDFVDKYFLGGIYSWETGIQKPDPEIFKILIRKYNINPYTSLFIDDKSINVNSAISVGFNGLVFNRINPLESIKELYKILKI